MAEKPFTTKEKNGIIKEKSFPIESEYIKYLASFDEFYDYGSFLEYFRITDIGIIIK